MLHETAVAWIRVRLAQTTPKRCWEETREQLRARLTHVVDTIQRHVRRRGPLQ